MNDKKDGMMCDCCGWNGKGGHHKMMVLRWLLGLIILCVTFSLGVKIGEFKQAVKDSWGYPSQMMGGSYGGYGSQGGYGGYGTYNRAPMMGWYTQTPQQGTATNNNTSPEQLPPGAR